MKHVVVIARDPSRGLIKLGGIGVSKSEWIRETSEHASIMDFATAPIVDSTPVKFVPASELEEARELLAATRPFLLDVKGELLPVAAKLFNDIQAVLAKRVK